MKNVLARLSVTTPLALAAAADSILQAYIREKAIITRSLRVGFILPLVALGGCSTTTVTSEVLLDPVQKYQAVALGDISSENELWDRLSPNFRQAFVVRIGEDRWFTTVFDPAPETLPGYAILVTGKITEVDEGNKEARVKGLFQIQDAKGAVLAKFESEKALSSGIGIGGVDFLGMEDLMARFGRDTAASVTRWSMGMGVR